MPRAKVDVPQTNDPWKLFQLPSRVKAGVNTVTLWAKEYEVDDRTAKYYAEAARMMGLIATHRESMRLTADGEKFLRLGAASKAAEFKARFLGIPAVGQILRSIKKDGLSQEEARDLLLQTQDLRPSTALRRAQAIMACFRWFAKQDGTFVYEGGRIYAPRP